MYWVRERVLLAQVSDLGEPGVLDAMVEDMHPMPVEDVFRSQEGHHMEEGELVPVNQGRRREGSRQEVKSRGRGAGVESLQPLKGLPSVDRKYLHLRWGEQEGGETTEHLGGGVASLHSKTCCRVPPVVSGHPARYHRVEGLCVASQPTCDAGNVGATRGAQDTNMLSLRGEGEGGSIHSDGVNFLPVLRRVVTLGLIEEQFCLLGNIYHVSGGGKGLGQVEE